jgi:16S rRNA (guanine966-N2)-methyltransferase
MRIVAGRWRGKALVAPPGQTTRPTGEKARQALFNRLEHAPWSPGVAGARVLDLFAGTGAFGLEALSRGAVHATFVEQDRAALAALRANIDVLGCAGQTRVLAGDATTGTAAGGPFTIIFADPPYRTGAGQTALAALATANLASGAVAIIETARDEPVTAFGDWVVLDERSYGAARTTVLVRK